VDGVIERFTTYSNVGLVSVRGTLVFSEALIVPIVGHVEVSLFAVGQSKQQVLGWRGPEFYLRGGEEMSLGEVK